MTDDGSYVSLGGSERRGPPDGSQGDAPEGDRATIVVRLRSRRDLPPLDAAIKLPLAERQYLSRRDFADQYGADPAGVQLLAEFAKQHHLKVKRTSVAERLMELSGTVGDLQKAFGHLDHFAKLIGLAFQVVDDTLDAESSTATLGKTAGKDAKNNKPTYVSAIGTARSRELAQELRHNALAALEGFGERARRLQQLADFIVLRKF